MIRLHIHLTLLFLALPMFADQLWPYNNIHVIGDSHGPYCFTQYPDKIPFIHTPAPGTPEDHTYETSPLHHRIDADTLISPTCSIHWVQLRTMHRVGRDGLDGLNVKDYDVEENDVVVFIVGFIDVAGHIFGTRKIG